MNEQDNSEYLSETAIGLADYQPLRAAILLLAAALVCLAEVEEAEALED